MNSRYAHFVVMHGQPHVYVVQAVSGDWTLPESPPSGEDYRIDELSSSPGELVFWRHDDTRIAQINGGGRWIPWTEAESMLRVPGSNLSVLRNAMRLSGRRIICAITGRKETSPRYTPETASAALAAGKIAASLGLTVLTGGLSGVMERAAEGARRVGGATIGILPGSEHRDANPYLDHVLPSGVGIARNCLMATACDLMVALPGGTGTLEEVCFALDFGRPVLSWGSWEIEGVRKVEFPAESVLRNALSSALGELMRAHYGAELGARERK